MYIANFSKWVNKLFIIRANLSLSEKGVTTEERRRLSELYALEWKVSVLITCIYLLSHLYLFVLYISIYDYTQIDTDVHIFVRLKGLEAFDTPAAMSIPNPQNSFSKYYFTVKGWIQDWVQKLDFLVVSES